MPYQKITRENYFERIVNSLKGIIVGIILLILGSVLLFWNEGRAVRARAALGEAKAAVFQIPSIAFADSVLDGKLVFATGLADTDEVLADDPLGIGESVVSGIARVGLMRNVEYYQWVETSTSQTRKKLGGGTETVTTYDYKKVWTDEPVDSSQFQYAQKYKNTVRRPGVQDVTQTASNVTFGAYKIPGFMKSPIGEKEPAEVFLSETAAEYIKANSQYLPVTAYGGTLYLSKSPQSPQVGDMRFTYTQRKPAEISLLAVVSGDTFEPFRASDGSEFWLVQNGKSTPEAMFKGMEKSNSATTWVLRIIGAVLVTIGFGLIFAPLSVLADVIPFLGSIVGAGTWLASFLLGFAWSFILIAVAWLRFRPLLGGGLLAAAALLVTLLYLRGRKLKNESESPV